MGGSEVPTRDAKRRPHLSESSLRYLSIHHITIYHRLAAQAYAQEAGDSKPPLAPQPSVWSWASQTVGCSGPA